MLINKKNNNILHSGIGAKTVYITVFIIFALYSLSIIFALSWSVLQSLKENVEFWDDMISLPKDWLFSNYLYALENIEYSNTNFWGMFVNSIWYSLGMSLLSVFFHCVTGYVFAKYKFWGREAAFIFILFTITIPIVGNLSSLYNIVYTLHLNDSVLFLVTALGGFGGNFLVTYGFFKNIDWSYAEAAQIDGAGHFYIFLFIMLPFAVGPIVALSLLGFITQWNNYETPILFLDKMPTLSSGLWQFKMKSIYVSNEPAYIAGIIITMIPVIATVIAFGNKIMENVTIGGIKG